MSGESILRATLGPGPTDGGNSQAIDNHDCCSERIFRVLQYENPSMLGWVEYDSFGSCALGRHP